MSTFTEEQQDFINNAVRKEVRRILDTGLMYTAEVDQHAQQPPKTQPQERPPQIPQTPGQADILLKFPEDLREYLTADKNGPVWIVKNRYVSKELWTRMNDTVKQLGGTWTGTDPKNKFWRVPA